MLSERGHSQKNACIFSATCMSYAKRGGSTLRGTKRKRMVAWSWGRRLIEGGCDVRKYFLVSVRMIEQL